MNNTFELKKGTLVFEADKIVIVDNAVNKKRYALFQSVAALSLGVSFVLKYFKTGDHSNLTFGLCMGTYGLLKFALEFFKSAKNEIFMKDVKSIKVKRILLYEFLAIKLNNNKTRQVGGILNIERLEDYITSNQLLK